MTMTDEKYRLAEKLMQEKRYDEAVALYEELVRLNPGEDSHRLALAWAYKDSGRLDEAVALFEELLEKELSRKLFTGFAFDDLVKIFREEKQYDRMIQICERAVAAQPDDVSLLFTLGDAYLAGGFPVKAIDAFKKIIMMDPDASSFMSLGNAQVAAGDFEGAEEAYEQAGSFDPSSSDVYYNRLGMAYLRAGYFDRAEIAFRKAIDCNATQPIYYCNVGDALAMEGRLDEAEAVYEEAAAINPGSRGVYLNRLGNTLHREKRYLQAIRVFKKAIEEEPKNPFYHMHLARSYEAAGFPEEARRENEKAQSLK
ncbi:MAG TPA: tetratricopeptide repeat protein [Syntrophales bacterium]|nr:tetratricopeptide repeat protein [Syntrophales bacterium]